MEKIEDKIKRTRKLLDNCYINSQLDYESKLKASQYMDKLISKYYKLKKDNSIKNVGYKK